VLILGFASSPLITRLISPQEYGIFSMFTLYTSLISIFLIFGTDQSYGRCYYEERNKEDLLLRKCIYLPIILSIVVSSVSLFFAKNLSLTIFKEINYQAVILLIVNTVIMVLNRFSLLVIRMKQKGKLYSNLQIIQKVLYLLFVFLFFWKFKNNYLTLLYATTISNLLITILSVYLEKESWKRQNKENNLVNSKKDIILYGLPFAVTLSITWIFQSIDRIAIQKFNSFNELGIYSAAFNIIALLNVLQSSFSTFWTPVALEKYEKDPESRDFFYTINIIVTIIMFIVGVLLIMCKDIIVLLLGAKYRSASFIMPSLVFMPIMYTISETTVIGINFKKKPKFHIVIAIVCTIVNLIGCFILVPMLGAKGAAMSTGISYILFYILRTHIANRLYRVNYSYKKYYIILLSVFTYSIYATFNSINIMYLLFGFLILGLIFVVYYNEILKIYKDNIERKVYPR
jgi:O-antigen/teichoic acid export membrane protein